MAWWGITNEGMIKLHFCEIGVKTKAHNYQIDILEGAVSPVNENL